MDSSGEEGKEESGSVRRKERKASGHAAGRITIIYTNAQSVIKKIDELRALAALKNPDIIALTETWTHVEINNEYLHIEGYQITASGS